MAEQQMPQRKVAIPCPNPQDEAEKGELKSKAGLTTIREMEMGVTVRKGESPVVYKYTREDR